MSVVNTASVKPFAKTLEISPTFLYHPFRYKGNPSNDTAVISNEGCGAFWLFSLFLTQLYVHSKGKKDFFGKGNPPDSLLLWLYFVYGLGTDTVHEKHTF